MKKVNSNIKALPDFLAITLILILVILSVFEMSCSKENVSQNDTGPEIRSDLLIPDTGQTTSYTSTQGEDSDISINSPSYTDNGNGSITDNITGLMWQKTDAGEMAFSSAATYCSNLVFAGFDDWRLPSTVELFSINNFDKLNPALNTDVFTKTAAEYWWANETRADNLSAGWTVNAGGGAGAHPVTETVSSGGTKKFHVRAVRNTKNVVIPENHFTDNGDGTVKDNYTGLIWQKNQPSGTMTWEEALVYASSLTIGGKSDWRLPNIKELQSLNDTKLYRPSVSKVYFPDMVTVNFWSSTTMVNAPVKAWDMSTEYGIVSYNEKTVKEYVICVR